MEREKAEENERDEKFRSGDRRGKREKAMRKTETMFITPN